MRFPTVPLGSKLPNGNLTKNSSNRKWWELFSHCHQMQKAGTQLTDPAFFHSILKACSSLPLRCGKSIHASLLKQGFTSFTSTANSIMDLYMKTGFLGSAFHVFDSLGTRDSVSWNIMIHGHLSKGACGEGLWWFMQARVAAFEPNVSTLVLVIHACRILGAMDQGLKTHGYIIRIGFLDIPSVQNSLLSMYADTDMNHAEELFDEMCERDVICWSVMIGGYTQAGEPQLALQLFREMVSKVMIQPDGITMVSVLKACTNIGDISIARLVHGFIVRRGFDHDLFVGNSIIDLYSRCDDDASAFKAFDKMPCRSIVSWNSILSGFVRGQKYSEAVSLFFSMEKAGFTADEVTLVNFLQTCKYFEESSDCKFIHAIVLRRGYELNELVMNSLIDAYAKCNLIEHAWKIFDPMKGKDMVTWSTMIAGFTHCGKPDEAVALFREMNLQAQEKPNEVTILALLEACSATADLKRSKWAHGIAVRRGLGGEVAVGTAILDMYSKCGGIELSRKVFDQIPEKNIVSWGAMIAACGMNGLARDALDLLAEMKLHGLRPNAVTTLSALSACSHCGLVEDGLLFFKNMVQDHGVEPGIEHYSCVIDMLGRAGYFDSAMDLIKTMPERLKASAGLWGSLLSSCRNNGNSRIGEGAASRVLELEPRSSAGYLLASSMYAASGRWADAARMRLLVRERGVKLVAGYSLVHVDNMAWKFVAGDESHPRAGEICDILDNLHNCMKIDHHDILGFGIETA